MIEEDIHRLLNIFTLVLLLFGGVIAIWICLYWSKIDKNLIKAKIFLNEKFLRKLWFYMFSAMAFFALDEALMLFSGNIGYITIMADVFKVMFVILILIVLYDYFILVKSCIRKSPVES